MKPKKEASIDALALTESLGLKTHRRECRKTWSKDEDHQLLDRLNACYPQQMASKTLDSRTVNWDLISTTFGGHRKANDCKKRWVTSLDPHLRRGKWTEEEDRHLVEMYNKYGALWQQVASHISGRTEHQCSKRYLEVLDPSVANRLRPWSESEDLRLIDLVEQYGTKWRTIAQNLESRPPLTCRNRWRNLLTSVVRERASARIMLRMSEVARGLKDDNISPDTHGASLGNNSAAPYCQEAASADRPETKCAGDVTNSKAAKRSASSDGSSQTTSGVPLHPPSHQHFSQLLQLKGHEAETAQSGSPAQPDAFYSVKDTTSDNLMKVRAAEKLPATTEWRYTMLPFQARNDNNPDIAAADGAQAQGRISHGVIDSPHLVEALVLHAAQHNVRIELHQHHHYRGGYEGFNDVHTGQSSPQHSESFSERKLPSTFSLGPEAHVTRLQHFNYLPPSTPLPQLQSSGGSPEGQRIINSRESSYESSKGSDLRRLLNAQEPCTDNSCTDGPRNGTASLDSMVLRNLSGEVPSSRKRQRVAEDDTGDDDHYPESMRTFKQDPETARAEAAAFRPVSQHHPLHSSGIMPGPEDWGFDEDEEDFMSAFGLYGHIRDKPFEPQMPVDDAEDELFPFNPS